MRIFHVPNDSSATGHHSFQVWGGVRATTGELRTRNCRLLSPETRCELGRRVLGLLSNYSGRGTYSQATPWILNAWNSGSRSSTIVSSIYLALTTNSVQPKTLSCYASRYDLDPRNVKASISEVYSYHLDIHSGFCLEVAGRLIQR